MPKSTSPRKVTLTVTSTGANGSATGSGTTEYISGRIQAIHLDYSASQANTSDVTIATTTAPTRSILVRSDSKTDGWFYPRVQVQDTAAADIAGEYDRVLVANDTLTVSIAQGNNNETVAVTILVEPL